MYQFYYAKEKKIEDSKWSGKLTEESYEPDTTRVTMWEEHCLECAAPICFGTCPNYEARVDGRCKRMENGIHLFKHEKAVGGYSAHVKFRKWGNMMTIIYPAWPNPEQLQRMQKYQRFQGNLLRFVLNLRLPVKLRWIFTRCVEFAFRYYLKKKKNSTTESEAFYLHAVSCEKESFYLIMEVFEEEKGVFRKSFLMKPGENSFWIPKEELSKECFKSGNLIKIYPEDNKEAELEFFWCDFVTGQPVAGERKEPADKVKCLVWDLDNTLWNGTLVEKEEGANLELRNGILEILQELDRRGILCSIASKNDETPAMEELKKLGVSEFFLYPQINWGAKSDSIKKIAKLLNIGTDTFAFIDDSVFEQKQVNTELPEVRIYDASDFMKLLQDSAFDVQVTEESSQRRLMYQAEVKRNEVKIEQGADIENFIAACQIKIKMFHPDTEQERMRCYELVQRTNQLNASGIKYSEERFEQILSGEKGDCWAFSCGDIYGSYGIVGFLCCRKKETVLEITEFAMSCRVAGKYVESAVFSWLLQEYEVENGTLSVVRTAKNGLLRRTLEEVGFIKEETEESNRYGFERKLKNHMLVTTIKRENSRDGFIYQR